MIEFLRNIFPKKIDPKIVGFLIECLNKLPHHTYGTYVRQLGDGLLRYGGNSNIDHPSFRNYATFTYDPSVSSRYENPKGRFSRLKNIRVEDKLHREMTLLSIYLSHGLVCGYAFENRRDFDPDLTTIDVSRATLEFLDSPDPVVERLISPNERHLVNWSDIYEVELDGTTFFHLRDIGDGDFIGMDSDGLIYEIRHDPYEVNGLEGSLSDIFKHYPLSNGERNTDRGRENEPN